MSGEFPRRANIVSPSKCYEKPWDQWISEIGHSSPLRDDDELAPSPAEAMLGASARLASHPYKPDRPTKHRKVGINRLKVDSMSLHGLVPQIDNLNAAVCHMCGAVVKCSAVHRHLLESHSDTEPILPPPATPTVKLKALNRSRHKKDIASLPVDILPVKMEMSPVNTPAPLSRVVLPQPELYLDDPSTSAAVSGELQVCVQSGELPVVSIQDTEDLPLGENITDDIFAIMNSEGIQSADDITNAADWKNIIRDIGNMQEINFSQTTDTPSQDMYAPIDTSSLTAYSLADNDLSNLQFAPNTSPILSSVIDNSNVHNVSTQALKTVVPSHQPTTPKSQSRSKTSKTKFHLREYDPNKHCGVVTADNPKPCTRSLTCKAHALSLRRTVEGRSKPFDTLLAEHRASREAAAAAAAMPAAPSTAVQHMPPLLVNTSVDLGTFNVNGLTAEQQVNDIYASLLTVDDTAVLPDTSTITSYLTQTLPTDILLPDDAEIQTEVPILSIPAPTETVPPEKLDEKPEEAPPPVVPSDVCWYSSCPRPLALCTFNASHAGGAITLGKKFATVRSNIKSSLTRSNKTQGSTNNYYYNQNALSLSKSVHMNASKTNKPEVRKLIVTCSSSGNKEVQQTLSELFGGGEVRQVLNGHVSQMGHERKGSSSFKNSKRPSSGVLDLGFSLDPLLADEKC